VVVVVSAGVAVVGATVGSGVGAVVGLVFTEVVGAGTVLVVDVLDGLGFG